MNKLTEHELFRRRMKMITDKEQLIEIYEQLVGDDGINRYTHKEIIDYINQLKDIEENEDDK